MASLRKGSSSCSNSPESDAVRLCTLDSHGSQVVRAVVWCQKELDAALLIKNICPQFALVNKRGITALHIAAAKGWLKMMRWLLRGGADVHARDQITGETPMHYAALFGRLQTMVLLSKAGGKCRKVCNERCDPLLHVSKNYWRDQLCLYRLSDQCKKQKCTDCHTNTFDNYAYRRMRYLSDMDDEMEVADITLKSHAKASAARVKFKMKEVLKPEEIDLYLKSCYSKNRNQKHSMHLRELQTKMRGMLCKQSNTVRRLNSSSSNRSARGSSRRVAVAAHDAHIESDYEDFGSGDDSDDSDGSDDSLVEWNEDLRVDSGCDVKWKRKYPDLPEQCKRNSLFVFGGNSNYNLGMGTTRSYDNPTLLSSLSRDPGVVLASMSKYHTLYLTGAGSVKACGLGSGGRLGTGSEETCVRPETVSFPPGIRIVAVAAAAEHSLFLTQDTEVYACGRNTFMQLGVHKLGRDKCCTTPQKVALPDLKDERILGVACGRHHSVLWTTSAVFTWGTNYGQLGHEDSVVPVPRRVKHSYFLRITQIDKVSVCDNATITAVENGDILCMYHHKIFSINTRYESSTTLKKMVVFGGTGKNKDKNITCSSSVSHEAVDSVSSKKEGVLHTFIDSDEEDSGNLFPMDDADLKIVMLTAGSSFYIWVHGRSSSYHLVPKDERDCRTYDLVDFVFTGKELVVVSNTGRVTKLSLHQLSRFETKKIGFKTYEVPYLHKARSIFCDPAGLNFAVLTTEVFLHHQMPKLKRETRLHCVLADLYKNASLDDDIHDAELLCQGKRYPVHKILLSAKSSFFREKFFPDMDGDYDKSAQIDEHCKCGYKLSFKNPNKNGSESEDLKPNESSTTKKAVSIETEIHSVVTTTSEKTNTIPTLSIDFIGKEYLEEILSYVYKGHCDRINYPNYVYNIYKANKKKSAESKKRRPSHFIEDEGSDESDASDDVLPECYSYLTDETTSNPLTYGRFENREEYFTHVNGVVKAAYTLRLDDFFDNHNLIPTIDLSRCHNYGCDVQFVGADGTLGPVAHKYMMASRSEYFETMLSTRWVQGASEKESGGLREIKNESPALVPLLQVLYTDHCCTCNMTLSQAQELLVLADQYLCPAVQQMAEQACARHVSPRNYTSLMHFAAQYNAQELLSCLRNYAAYNFTLLLENKSLENLGAEDLESIERTFMAERFHRIDVILIIQQFNVYCYDLLPDAAGPRKIVMPSYNFLRSVECLCDDNKKCAHKRVVEANHVASHLTHLAVHIESDPMLTCKMFNLDIHEVLMLEAPTLEEQLNEPGYLPTERVAAACKPKRRWRKLSGRSNQSSESEDEPPGPDLQVEGRSMDFEGLVDRYENDTDEDTWHVAGSTKSSKNRWASHFVKDGPTHKTVHFPFAADVTDHLVRSGKPTLMSDFTSTNVSSRRSLGAGTDARSARQGPGAGARGGANNKKSIGAKNATSLGTNTRARSVSFTAVDAGITSAGVTANPYNDDSIAIVSDRNSVSESTGLLASTVLKPNSSSAGFAAASTTAISSVPAPTQSTNASSSIRKITKCKRNGTSKFDSSVQTDKPSSPKSNHDGAQTNNDVQNNNMSARNIDGKSISNDSPNKRCDNNCSATSIDVQNPNLKSSSGTGNSATHESESNNNCSGHDTRDRHVSGGGGGEEENTAAAAAFPSLSESMGLVAKQQPKSGSVNRPLPFPKTSQKQRKRQQRGEQQEEEAAAATIAANSESEMNNENTSATAAADAPAAWGEPARGICCDGGHNQVSFSNITDQQKQQQQLQPKQQQQKQQRSKIQETEQSQIVAPSIPDDSSRHRRQERTTSMSSTGSEPACSTNEPLTDNFSLIMQRELNLKNSFEKKQRKSLDDIQMEERAMMELSQYYRSMSAVADSVTVTRLRAEPAALPLWTQRHRPRDLTQ